MYFDVDFKKEKVDWHGFENRIADIFEEFGYSVERDVRFKTMRRFQIDVIASDDNRCFFIDCKDHSYIPPSEEESFIIKQRVRAENLLKTRPELMKPKKFLMLVTRNRTASLINHEYGGGKVLSVHHSVLNDLLTNISVYEGELLSF